jgi:hypothetical protein
MIHYLPYANALEALQWMYAVGSPACHLFISASGLGSELGQGYSAASTPVEERFATLAPEMAAKHAIEPRVCLYRVDELVTLLERARWHVIESFSSPFGNAKAIASKVQ